VDQTLLPAAEIFNEGNYGSSNSKQIEICYGPESTWRNDALECAGGLMTAAEQQTAGMMRVYGEILKSKEYGKAATPITMHKSTLLVPKGNPKNITNFNNLLERDDVGLVIVDGLYHDTLTSGTALWEDVVGRTKRLEDTVNLREKVCYVAGGAGAARDELLENPNCDAWIYWSDWVMSNTDKFDEVQLPEELEIYRDLNIIPTSNPDGDAVEDFINFVLNSVEADALMQDAGWKKDWNIY
jgi:accessory colonization factor AcfC